MLGRNCCISDDHLPSDFVCSSAFGRASDGLSGAVQRDGLETRGIIRSGRYSHDEQLGSVGRVHSKCIICCKMKRPDVETELCSSRDPSFFNLHQLCNKVHQLLSVEVGQSQSSGRPLESLRIAPRPEESQFSLLIPVCLHALEALDAVVQT